MVENHSTLLTNVDKIDTALYSGSTVEMQRNAVKDSYYRMKHGYKEAYFKIENSIKSMRVPVTRSLRQILRIC